MHPVNLDKYLKGEIYHYEDKGRYPFGFKNFGFLLIAFSIFSFIYVPIWSILSGILAIGIFLYKDGIEVDFASKKYRYFTSFGSQIFGKWKDISDLHYISVFSTNLTRTFKDPFPPKMWSTTLPYKEVMQVNLIVGHNERLRLFETGDMQSDVFGFANQLASKLNLRIWDATERKGKWYKPDTADNLNMPLIPPNDNSSTLT